jgi:hypothetical protein
MQFKQLPGNSMDALERWEAQTTGDASDDGCVDICKLMQIAYFF